MRKVIDHQSDANDVEQPVDVVRLRVGDDVEPSSRAAAAVCGPIAITAMREPVAANARAADGDASSDEVALGRRRGSSSTVR